MQTNILKKETENIQILKRIDLIKEGFLIEQDFRGCSSALRYICQKQNQKYFVKIYKMNRIEDIEYIDSIYKELKIPTANVIEKGYLKEFDKTYVIYEFIEGKTLLELTKEKTIKELEKIGKRVGKYLAKFKILKCEEEKVAALFEQEIKKLIEILYYMRDYYNKNGTQKLEFIDIDRLCSVFNNYKKYLYNIGSTFIHKDINLKNIIVKDEEVYFIDTDGGKFSFRALDFRGICWWTWDGEKKLEEQAIYRGIFKGLLGETISDDFHKELAFTIIYEFLLKIEEVSVSKDLGRMEYIFSKFSDIFNRTNYFGNDKFDWIN